jgi:hypothetical protein
MHVDITARLTVRFDSHFLCHTYSGSEENSTYGVLVLYKCSHSKPFFSEFKANISLMRMKGDTYSL